MAESGYLVAEIRAVKRQDDNTFYLLDAGFNNLARPILYGSYHPMSIVPADGDTRRPEQDVIVGGPLCESGDIFTQEEGGFVSTRRLPAAQVGDLLVIECAGAYGFVMGSNYNSRPLAAEVLLRDGRPHLIRRRQTFDDLIRGEEIPPALHDRCIFCVLVPVILRAVLYPCSGCPHARTLGLQDHGGQASLLCATVLCPDCRGTPCCVRGESPHCPSIGILSASSRFP